MRSLASAKRWHIATALAGVGALAVASPLVMGTTQSGAPLQNGATDQQPARIMDDRPPTPMMRLLNSMRDLDMAGPIRANLELAPAVPDAAHPLIFAGKSDDRQRALSCLATTAWYEAGNDAAGERAVIQVVLNRVRHPAFPNSICGVVLEGANRKTGCQFSYLCDGSLQRRAPSSRDMAKAVALAESALGGSVDKAVGQATHYHADYVNPLWNAVMQRVSKVGPHIFYRWGGLRGALNRKLVFDDHGEPAIKPVLDRNASNAGDTKQTGDTTRLALDSDALNWAKPGESQVGGQGGLATGGAVRTSQNSMKVMLVDQGGPNGRWAVSAMNLCPGDQACRVAGYGKAGEPDANAQPGDVAKGKPLFLFVRDGSGMSVALWDCQRAPRPDARQCMPDGAELAGLMGK
ncbi:cell wall hydrolase [Novosphingobium sp. ZN18A2]|uniref:cell wall hydrolase n=1 Tax=Novosphingobium sp. ZN18A2 TaxID=3079861 RepID=UPI0030CD9C20